ncbi:hypothetical protein GJU40_09050 [Bacillus lacus]|uniref:Uncharacterized protein n=1 Tax=Metabacillus lacus TaxID=1983721 RepID=A0A7X2J035_9BACI|nr:hypothetical protein [Metabacillus lacus]MRX72298.1 hypothetical protein [Metabacillus lacus]
MNKSPRRYAASMNTVSTNLFHFRNPWVIAWWSAAFPGFGHYLLGKLFTGFLLMVWEVIINNLAHLNEAIVYSMTGRFHRAAEVLDMQWLLLYIALYIFTIWDSFRRTTEYNKYYILAYREGYNISSHCLSPYEINILVKRKPLYALFWSLLAPGLGYFYLNRLPSIIFNLLLWIVVAYYSHIYELLFLSLTGQFLSVHEIVEYQWLLYVPSLYCFIAYDSYISCIEYNKLFDKEQARYLKSHYQHLNFKMPQ